MVLGYCLKAVCLLRDSYKQMSGRSFIVIHSGARESRKGWLSQGQCWLLLIGDGC